MDNGDTRFIVHAWGGDGIRELISFEKRANRLFAHILWGSMAANLKHNIAVGDWEQMLTQSDHRPVALIAGIAVSTINVLVLRAAAIRALRGPFDNSPLPVIFVALALLGPVTATLAHRGSRRRGTSEADSRRRAGRTLLGCGLPVMVLSLLLLVI